MKWQPSARRPALVAHPPAASLDEAHAAIDLWQFYSRKQLDAEQRLAVELMMAETEDGRWAADTTGRAESRQNGKGDEIEVVELYGLTQRAEAILHTAHEAATAASAHGRLVGLIEGHRDLSRKVIKKQSWNGNYSLRLDNEGIIVWRTRTGAGGRGLDDISRIVIDEAQHAQPEELASSLPILSVNPNPQKNFLGSGAIAGKSAFWWRLRLRGLQPAGRFSWLEHSAETISLDEDGKLITSVGDVADPATWMLANPAYPSRISHDFLLDQLETLGPELFAREHLCVWDAPGGDVERATVVDMGLWATLEDIPQERPSRIALGVAASSDRKWSYIGLAGEQADGRVHLQIIKTDRGTSWVIGELVRLKREWKPVGIVIGANDPAASLIPDIERTAGLKIEVLQAKDAARAAGMFIDGVNDETLSHAGGRLIDLSVENARKKAHGDAFTFTGPADGSIDIAPLKAVTLALLALRSSRKTGSGSKRRAATVL